MDSCQTVQHITDHASPAGSAPNVCGSLVSADTLLAVQTRRGNPVAAARRAGGTTGGSPPLLFSGYRPIANRGQQ